MRRAGVVAQRLAVARTAAVDRGAVRASRGSSRIPSVPSARRSGRRGRRPAQQLPPALQRAAHGHHAGPTREPRDRRRPGVQRASSEDPAGATPAPDGQCQQPDRRDDGTAAAANASAQAERYAGWRQGASVNRRRARCGSAAGRRACAAGRRRSGRPRWGRAASPQRSSASSRETTARALSSISSSRSASRGVSPRRRPSRRAVPDSRRAEVGERGLPARLGPRTQRAHAGGQLLAGERLDEVVVGAGVEPRDAVIDAVARRQQQDRDREPSRAGGA